MSPFKGMASPLFALCHLLDNLKTGLIIRHIRYGTLCFIKMDRNGEVKSSFFNLITPPQKYPRSVQISRLVQYLRKEICLGVVTSCPMGIGDQSLLKFTQVLN